MAAARILNTKPLITYPDAWVAVTMSVEEAQVVMAVLGSPSTDVTNLRINHNACYSVLSALYKAFQLKGIDNA